MSNKFLHDEIYRGSEAVAKLAKPLVTVCGAGALGSNLADNLSRQGFGQLRVIDFDRVEEHNINTQVYGIGDVGALKVDVLKNRLFRSIEIEIEAVGRRLDVRSVKKQLKDSSMVVDTFDNSVSRQLVQDHCRTAGLPCLHVGLYADYCEVIWDQNYRVPADAEGDVCDYPLARNLVLIAVAIASEAIIRFILCDEQINRTATLTDFSIQPLET